MIDVIRLVTDRAAEITISDFVAVERAVGNFKGLDVLDVERAAADFRLVSGKGTVGNGDRVPLDRIDRAAV